MKNKIYLAILLALTACSNTKETTIYKQCIAQAKNEEANQKCLDLSEKCIERSVSKQNCETNFNNLIEIGSKITSLNEKIKFLKSNLNLEIKNLEEKRASLKNNEVSLKSWQALFSKNSEPFNGFLWASLDNYYNYNFRSSNDTHFSIRLKDEDGTVIHGYIKKDSLIGKSLFSYLRDGCNLNKNFGYKNMCPVSIILLYCNGWDKISKQCLKDESIDSSVATILVGGEGGTLLSSIDLINKKLDLIDSTNSSIQALEDEKNILENKREEILAIFRGETK